MKWRSGDRHAAPRRRRLLGARQPARHVPRARQAPRSVLRLLAERRALRRPAGNAPGPRPARGGARRLGRPPRAAHLRRERPRPLPGPGLRRRHAPPLANGLPIPLYGGTHLRGRRSRHRAPGHLHPAVRPALGRGERGARPSTTTRGPRRRWTRSRPASTPASLDIGRKGLPVEFKILDYRPEPWSDYKCALLLKAMANVLTSYNQDAAMTRMRGWGGGWADSIKTLFPDHPPLVDPVIPPGTPLDFTPLPVAGARVRSGERRGPGGKPRPGERGRNSGAAVSAEADEAAGPPSGFEPPPTGRGPVSAATTGPSRAA
ncbi:MAG: penicillin acylase family protein [Sphingobacterium sp.]|nr:penicillin acylase family protein [Sphingobacterium sp.]